MDERTSNRDLILDEYRVLSNLPIERKFSRHLSCKGGIGDPCKLSFFSDRNDTDSTGNWFDSLSRQRKITTLHSFTTAHDYFLSVNGLDLSACNHGTEYFADLSQLKKISNRLSLQPGVK